MTGEDPRLKYYVEFLTRHRELLSAQQETWCRRYLEAYWGQKGKLSPKQYAGIARLYEALTEKYPGLA